MHEKKSWSINLNGISFSITFLLFIALSLSLSLFPTLRYRLPRLSDSWVHLLRLSRISSYGLTFDTIVYIFEHRYYPLFYIVMALLGITTPFAATLVASINTFLIALATFFLAREATKDDKVSVIAGALLSSSNIFLLAENVFFPEALAILLYIIESLLIIRKKYALSIILFPLLLLSHPLITYLFLLTTLIYALALLRTSEWRFFPFWGFYLISSLIWFYHCGTLEYALIHLPQWIWSPIILGSLIVTFFLCVIIFLKLSSLPGKPPIDFFDNKGKIVVLLIILSGSFLYYSIYDVPSTQYHFSLNIILFYLPNIVLGILGLVNIRKNHDFIKSWIIGVGLSILFALFIVGPALPVSRHLGIFIPALAVSAALTYRKNKAEKILILLLLVFLVITAYPPPDYVFGFDVQYYPQEYEALEWLSKQPMKPIITDLRMRAMAEYVTGFPAYAMKIPDPNKPPPVDCYLVITRSMILYGAEYEWWMKPIKVDLQAFLASPHYKLIYENDYVWIFTTDSTM